MSSHQVPVNMSKAELLNILQSIIDHIVANDSLEGTFTYSIPENPKSEHPFDVMATFRVGNSRGQGSVIIIGDWVGIEASETGNETVLENPEGGDSVRKDL